MQKRFFMWLGRLRSPLACSPLRVDQNADSTSAKFPGGFLAVAALIAVCYLGFSSQAQAAQQLLEGHVPRITKRLTSTGRLESSTRLDLAIGLPLRNRE